MVRGTLLIFLVAGAVLAQKPGAVEGIVTNTATQAPVKKALVTLRSRYENAGYQTLTDAAGHFRIDNVKPGNYGLWAEAQGYARDVDRFFAPSQKVQVAEDKTIQDFAIRLDPLSAISGRVLDENGDPVAGATVDGLRYTYSHTGPHLGHWVSATTNDRGEYRVFGLTPGRWYLRVYKSVRYAAATGRVHRTGTEAEYGYTFYPGVTREQEAGAIEVAAGAELSQIDVPIRKTRAYHVRGKVIDGRSGQPAAKARVRIQDTGYVETRPDGTFDVRSLTRGSYRMIGQVTGDPLLLSAVHEVAITERDVDGVVLRLDPVAAIQGMAVAEGAAAAKLPGARLTLEPLGGFGEDVPATIASDGSFVLGNVAPQAYRMMVNRRAPGLYLKALRLGNQDASSDGRIDLVAGAPPLALAFASDAGSVEGSVQSAGPGPAPIVVTLSPAGPLAARMDLVETVDTESDGSFKIECAAPGEYQLFAWELADQNLAEYPDFRKLLESKATPVTVRAGEKQLVRLTVIPAAEVEQARRKLR